MLIVNLVSISILFAPDSPGCVCGFMSVERMRVLLGLDTVGNLRGGQQRQQITPDMKFTCDGLITKWIVGADWHNDDYLYPELQVWRRNVVNNTYHKINGTFLNIETWRYLHFLIQRIFSLLVYLELPSIGKNM